MPFCESSAARFGRPLGSSNRGGGAGGAPARRPRACATPAKGAPLFDVPLRGRELKLNQRICARQRRACKRYAPRLAACRSLSFAKRVSISALDASHASLATPAAQGRPKRHPESSACAVFTWWRLVILPCRRRRASTTDKHIFTEPAARTLLNVRLTRAPPIATPYAPQRIV